MIEQALVSTGTIAAASTIVLATVGVLTFVANLRLYRETSKQNTATLGIAIEQMEAARGQLDAINEQAEIARKALVLQVTPRLIPGGAESCRVGQTETVTPLPQRITTVPIFLGITNAGNGVAIIDVDDAEAACAREGTHRPMTIILPPALSPGAQGVIKLTPEAAMENEGVAVGNRYEALIPYRGDGAASKRQWLRFSARYFSDSHWKIRVLDSEA